MGIVYENQFHETWSIREHFSYFYKHKQNNSILQSIIIKKVRKQGWSPTPADILVHEYLIPIIRWQIQGAQRVPWNSPF